MDSPSMDDEWRIPLEWARLPVEHLQAALAALEPQMKREHALRLRRLELEYRTRQLQAETQRVQQQHERAILGQKLGFGIALATMASAIIAARYGDPWLALALAGPSLLALAKLFVLRRSDPADMTAVASVTSAAAKLIAPTGRAFGSVSASEAAPANADDAE